MTPLNWRLAHFEWNIAIELLQLTSRNLHSDILAGNKESARAPVALVLTVVEQ